MTALNQGQKEYEADEVERGENSENKCKVILQIGGDLASTKR